MKAYIRVVKLLFSNMLRLDKSKKNAGVAILVLLGVLYFIIEAGLIITAVTIGPMFAGLGILNELIAILFAVAAIIVAIFGIVSMLSFLYFSRDTEFFLSLPLKPGTVFAAKFTMIYLTELLLSALLLLPVLIVLGIVTSAPIAFYPIIILGVLLAPSVPLVLAALIAIPLMYMVSFFKNKGALTSVVVILLFGGVFAIYYFVIFRFQFSGGEMSTDPAVIIDSLRGMFASIANTVYPYLALARLATLTPSFGLGATASFFVNLLFSFGVIVLLIAIAVLISGLVYTRGAASQFETAKHKATGKEKYVQSGILKALIKKEWKTMIRTPSFAYQCLMIVVLAPILVFVLGFSVGTGEEAAAFLNIPGITWIIFSGIMTFFLGINIAPSTAFTREGKCFYMLKTLPVDAKTQVRAKTILNFIISAAAILLGSIVALVQDPNPLLWFVSVTILLAYAYGYNSAATLFDLRKPKLDWTTPHEAVKANMNAAIPTFINMAMSFVLIGCGAVLYLIFLPTGWSVFAVYTLLALVSVALTGIFPYMLGKKAEAYFEQIES